MTPSLDDVLRLASAGFSLLLFIGAWFFVPYVKNILNDRVEDMKSKFTEQTQLNAKLNTMLDNLIEDRKKNPDPKKSKAPDPLEDPDGYKEWVKEETKKEIEAATKRKEDMEDIRKQQEAS